MSGRQHNKNGFDVAASFATMMVLTMGFVFSLALIFAFSKQAEFSAAWLTFFYVALTCWLFIPRERSAAAGDDLKLISSANKTVITKKHHYKLKKIRSRNGRMGQNQPPTAEKIREIKQTGVVFVPPTSRSAST